MKPVSGVLLLVSVTAGVDVDDNDMEEKLYACLLIF